MSYEIGFHSPAAYLPRANVVPQKINSEKAGGGEVAVNDDLSADQLRRSEFRVISGGRESQAQDQAAQQREAKEARERAATEKAEVREQRLESERQENAREARERSEEYQYEFERRNVSFAPGPAEIVGTPDALSRLDRDTDGRIDQLELRNSYRANSETTTYAALSQYRKSLELVASPEPTQGQSSRVSEDA